MNDETSFSCDTDIWLEFAEYDLKTAKWNYKGKIYTSACYTCQQVAEKSLKAYLFHLGHAAPKIHSLDRLITEIKKRSGAISTDIEQKALELDHYYITARYPGQYGGPEGLYTKKEAQEAIQAAESILKSIKNLTT